MINGGKIKGRADGLERHVEIAPYFLLLFASLGYFFTVSKTALLLYETSNRYQASYLWDFVVVSDGRLL